jgi:hypothetical protein
MNEKAVVSCIDSANLSPFLYTLMNVLSIMWPSGMCCSRLFQPCTTRNYAFTSCIARMGLCFMSNTKGRNFSRRTGGQTSDNRRLRMSGPSLAQQKMNLSTIASRCMSVQLRTKAAAVARTQQHQVRKMSSSPATEGDSEAARAWLVRDAYPIIFIVSAATLFCGWTVSFHSHFSGRFC